MPHQTSNISHMSVGNRIDDHLDVVGVSPVTSSINGLGNDNCKMRQETSLCIILYATWHSVLMFSLICAWENGWANNRDAGDLRCIRAHHDVTVRVILLDFSAHASVVCDIQWLLLYSFYFRYFPPLSSLLAVTHRAIWSSTDIRFQQKSSLHLL